MILCIFDAYFDYDKKALAEMQTIEANLIEGIQAEFGINFDFYAIGDYSFNVLHLQHNLYAIIIDFEENGQTKEAIEDDLNFLTSFEVCVDYFWFRNGNNYLFLEG